MISLGDLGRRYRVSDDPLRTERRVELILLIMICILVLQIVYSAWAVGRSPAIIPIAPAPDALVPAQGLAVNIPTMEQSEEIESRPLFWAGRRPVKSALKEQRVKQSRNQVSSTQKPGSLKNVQLVGVVAQGDSGIVILLEGGKKKRLSKGDEIQNWKVVSIDDGGAKLRNGPDVQRLDLAERTIGSKAKINEMNQSSVGDAVKGTRDTKAEAEAKAEKEAADNTLSFGGG